MPVSYEWDSKNLTGTFIRSKIPLNVEINERIDPTDDDLMKHFPRYSPFV